MIHDVLLKSCARSARVAALRVLSGRPDEACGGLRRAELQLQSLDKKLPTHSRTARLARKAVELATAAAEAALLGREEQWEVDCRARKAIRAADRALGVERSTAAFAPADIVLVEDD